MVDEMGELLRDFGVAQVTASSPEEWKASYKTHASRWFAGLAVGTVVVGEQLREALEPVIGKAHHANAWSAMAGASLRAWKKDRRLRDHGSTTAKGASAHARLCRQYLKVKD